MSSQKCLKYPISLIHWEKKINALEKKNDINLILFRYKSLMTIVKIVFSWKIFLLCLLYTQIIINISYWGIVMLRVGNFLWDVFSQKINCDCEHRLFYVAIYIFCCRFNDPRNVFCFHVVACEYCCRAVCCLMWIYFVDFFLEKWYFVVNCYCFCFLFAGL